MATEQYSQAAQEYRQVVTTTSLMASIAGMIASTGLIVYFYVRINSQLDANRVWNPNATFNERAFFAGCIAAIAFSLLVNFTIRGFRDGLHIKARKKVLDLVFPGLAWECTDVDNGYFTVSIGTYEFVVNLEHGTVATKFSEELFTSGLAAYHAADFAFKHAQSS